MNKNLRRILVVALVFCALQFVASDSRETKQQLSWIYKNWWSDMRSGEWERAYFRMSPAYRERHTQQDFYREFYFAGEENFRLHENAHIGQFKRTARIFPGDAKNPGVGGPEYHLVRRGDTWYFTGEVEQYKDRKNAMLAGILW